MDAPALPKPPMRAMARVPAPRMRVAPRRAGVRAPIVALLALFVLAPLAAAQDFPHLKPGLWELTRTSNRASDARQGITVCVDETVQRQMYDVGGGAMKGLCSRHEFHIHGNRGVGEFTCNLGTTTLHSKSVMTIHGDTAYHTETDTTYDPPLMGRTHSHSVLEARYTGPCHAGQRPGDMTLPNGRTINLRDALARHPAAPPPSTGPAR
jgi:hypothetical protein